MKGGKGERERERRNVDEGRRGRSRMWVRGRDGEGKCGRGEGTEKEYVGEGRREDGGLTLKGRE